MRRALFSLLFLGCASSPTPPPRVVADCPEPSAEVTVTARRPPPPSLDGRWMLSEIDDEDVEVVFDLSDGEGTARSARTNEPEAQVSVLDAEGGMKRLRLSRAGETEAITLFWSFTGPGRALVFREGDDDLAVARRAGPVPPDLQGRWVAEEPDDGDLVFFELRGDRAEMREGEQVHEGSAAGLGRDGERWEIAVGMRRGQRERLTVLVLQQVGPDVFLGWPAGDDDYRVVYRPGARPSWLMTPRPEPRAVPDTPPSAPTP